MSQRKREREVWNYLWDLSGTIMKEKKRGEVEKEEEKVGNEAAGVE